MPKAILATLLLAALMMVIVSVGLLRRDSSLGLEGDGSHFVVTGVASEDELKADSVAIGTLGWSSDGCLQLQSSFGSSLLIAPRGTSISRGAVILPDGTNLSIGADVRLIGGQSAVRADYAAGTPLECRGVEAFTFWRIS